MIDLESLIRNAVAENGVLAEADCCYPDCPHAPDCPIAKSNTEFLREV